MRAIDRLKDQTFFLSQIPQRSLQQTMFPLGKIECLHSIEYSKMKS